MPGILAAREMLSWAGSPVFSSPGEGVKVGEGPLSVQMC